MFAFFIKNLGRKTRTHDFKKKTSYSELTEKNNDSNLKK